MLGSASLLIELWNMLKRLVGRRPVAVFPIVVIWCYVMLFVTLKVEGLYDHPWMLCDHKWKSMKIMSTCPRGKNMWQMEALRASEPQVMACRCHTRRHSQAAGMRHSIGHSWSFHIFIPYGMTIWKNIWKNIIPYVSIHILWLWFFHIFFHPAATGSACCGGPSKDGQVPFV